MAKSTCAAVPGTRQQVPPPGTHQGCAQHVRTWLRSNTWLTDLTPDLGLTPQLNSIHDLSSNSGSHQPGLNDSSNGSHLLFTSKPLGCPYGKPQENEENRPVNTVSDSQGNAISGKYLSARNLAIHRSEEYKRSLEIKARNVHQSDTSPLEHPHRSRRFSIV
ncbi:hypothetical protein PCASD_22469 [Puccinia coronata f. sp. avenae]|uniref:Uncharacterized protein n=1 Tax=Puccinia coronata f. sp. avenae TaxID=200324 RepID=A0A2N5SHY2_9BASI|nr:hypothetical protein PCASD_22469 [Puccinia coronata f. sp. avenae]